MAASFLDFSKTLMDEYLSWDPLYATQLGWHKYDKSMRDVSRQAVEQQAMRCAQLIEELKRYPPDSLTPAERVDRDLAEHLLRLWLYEVKELKMHERVSSAATDIGNALFPLMIREHPSFDDRLEAIIARLEAVPQFLERSRNVLRAPNRVWNEEAYEAGREIPALLRGIEALVVAKPLTPDRRDRLTRAMKKAADELEKHNNWLKGTIIPKASPRYALTPSEYATYISMKGYGVNPDEALRIGDVYLDLAKRKMRETVKEILPGGDQTKALEMMKSDRPRSFDEAFKEYKDAVRRCRDFVIKSNLLTVPSGEDLVVLETPEFMRPIIPFQTQLEPGKFDTNRTGLFLVTPTGDNTELLKEHAFSTMANSAVHEGYPGHHVQSICSRSNPSYIRALCFSPDYIEGWGLYVEDLMLQQGFNSTPMGRLANLNDLIYRIVRLIAEIKLSKGFLTLDSAAELFRKECGIEITSAKIEARSCAMFPAYYSAYLIGKLAIMQLREEVQMAMAEKYSLKAFHDMFLYSGCMPVKLMRQAVAVKLKEQYDVALPPRTESLYQYAMRRAKSGKL